MGQAEEPTDLSRNGSVSGEEVPVEPDENGIYPHHWMMVGYWELDHQQIFESFVTGKALHLGEPHNVDGPGCIECGLHWMTGKHKPCEPQEFPQEEK